MSNVQLAGAMDVLNSKMDALISAIKNAHPGFMSEFVSKRDPRPVKAKRGRSKSAYNVYMSEELAKLKVTHPDVGHRKRFAMAVSGWPSAKASQADPDPEPEPETDAEARVRAESAGAEDAEAMNADN